MIVVKLGGSVITDKSKLRTFRRATCARLGRELASAQEQMIVVHGAGSFGHIEAKRHELHKGYKRSSQIEHVAAVQRDVRELNLKVLGTLIDKGVRAVSVPPATSAKFTDGRISEFDPAPFITLLDLRLTPVSFGDVVPDRTMGFSICSGDLIIEAIASEFEPRLVVFCADVDGVFDSDPKVDKGAMLLSTVDRKTASGLRASASRRPDVTGSIHGKLERMLAIAQHCEKCMIVNGNVPGRLQRALSGREVVSTVVVPG